MKLVLSDRFWYYVVAVALIGIALTWLLKVVVAPQSELVVTTVETGTIEQLVSVSGTVEARGSADLTFPTAGRVETVEVSKGDTVERGQVLATLERNTLLAEQAAAVAALRITEADYTELLNGPSVDQRDVTTTTVSQAESNLIRVTAEEEEKVANAKRALYSSDLEAFLVSGSKASVAPTITGTYLCDLSGEYELDMYRSSTNSGYSYLLSGLESGVFEAGTSFSEPMGKCGLRAQFTPDTHYGSTIWRVPIPNMNGASYVTNLNAYQLALEQADKNITAAAEAVDLVKKEQTLENAAPRSEALQRSKATVDQARARVAAASAAVQDRVLKAPFAGTITDLDIVAGETIGSEPIMTLLSEESFELTVRIPEIDISKVHEGQEARATFDAKSSERVPLTIDFVSPLATEIDGVAYFEATLSFTDIPSWIKAGLNADVDIVTDSMADVLVLPKRYIKEYDDYSTVLLLKDDLQVETKVETGFEGSSGLVEITGLTEGDLVVAP